LFFFCIARIARQLGHIRLGPRPGNLIFVSERAHQRIPQEQLGKKCPQTYNWINRQCIHDRSSACINFRKHDNVQVLRFFCYVHNPIH